MTTSTIEQDFNIFVIDLVEMHLVHDLGIGLGEGVWHVGCLGSEFEGAGMLPVLPLTQNLSCFFGFLNIN